MGFTESQRYRTSDDDNSLIEATSNVIGLVIRTIKRQMHVAER